MKIPDHSPTPYGKSFYDQQSEGSLRSARVIVPLVINMINPSSVVDIGCGIGTWLRAFDECGIHDYVGIDGDYVERSQLIIPAERFLPMDLTRSNSFDRVFDLAISLEVAEHLSASASPYLIRMLTDAAPVVLFSAALPGQGGIDHTNEQWPWYWENLFAQHDYVRIDLIRAQVWLNPSVDWWYKQNIFLFIKNEYLNKYKNIQFEQQSTQDHSMELVRTSILRHSVTPSFRELIRMLPKSAGQAIGRLLKSYFNKK